MIKETTTIRIDKDLDAVLKQLADEQQKKKAEFLRFLVYHYQGGFQECSGKELKDVTSTIERLISIVKKQEFDYLRPVRNMVIATDVKLSKLAIEGIEKTEIISSNNIEVQSNNGDILYQTIQELITTLEDIINPENCFMNDRTDLTSNRTKVFTPKDIASINKVINRAKDAQSCI